MQDYVVTDPQGVYSPVVVRWHKPITWQTEEYLVKLIGMEKMFQCPVADVDSKVAVDVLSSLSLNKWSDAKSPFLITTYYPNDQSFIFACGSPEAVKFFLKALPQPVDPEMVSVAERKPNGKYENVLLDLFQ